MKSILNILPKKTRYLLENKSINELQEIRLRIDKPLILKTSKGEEVLNELLSKEDIRELLSYVSRYSLYAYEEEMRQGFITIEGGHRVGLAGQVIIEKGKVKNIKYVSSVNIRLSHEIKGCADTIFPYIVRKGTIYHTLIVSPPGCGKTTLLRDVIRQISDGNSYMNGQTVGVVDERSEIGGCYAGVPQNHLGIRTDILDGCPKAEGMMLLIRTMNPDVIAVDEIGTSEDVQAVSTAIHCGCKMLATVHGNSIDEIRNKPYLSSMMREGQFERYIILGSDKKTGEIKGIYDKRGKEVFL